MPPNTALTARLLRSGERPGGGGGEAAAGGVRASACFPSWQQPYPDPRLRSLPPCRKAAEQREQVGSLEWIMQDALASCVQPVGRLEWCHTPRTAAWHTAPTTTLMGLARMQAQTQLKRLGAAIRAATASCAGAGLRAGSDSGAEGGAGGGEAGGSDGEGLLAGLEGLLQARQKQDQVGRDAELRGTCSDHPRKSLLSPAGTTSPLPPPPHPAPLPPAPGGRAQQRAARRGGARCARRWRRRLLRLGRARRLR